jgi:hypothetical protein
MGAMKIHSNPIYRKVIIPWYDSHLLCGITLFLLLIVFYFGWTGITTAKETPEYEGYIWVPWAITVISALATGSMAFRLVTRYVGRFRDYE